jgi:hypothetical protein
MRNERDYRIFTQFAVALLSLNALDQITTVISAATGTGHEANPFWNNPPTILAPLITQHVLATKLLLVPALTLLLFGIVYQKLPHVADNATLSKCLATVWLVCVSFTILLGAMVVLNNIAVILGWM